VFPNPAPQRDYVIRFDVPEFTCHCPLTGQPDFAHFTIEIVADELCVELKSLKSTSGATATKGAFHEKVTNTILDDIVKAIHAAAALHPHHRRLVRARRHRNGRRIRSLPYTNVVAEHRKKGWKPPSARRAAIAAPDAAASQCRPSSSSRRDTGDNPRR
jgi:7-cyano-7-deazaguanine reductase